MISINYSYEEENKSCHCRARIELGYPSLAFFPYRYFFVLLLFALETGIMRMKNISPKIAFALVSFFLGELGDGLNIFQVRICDA